MTDPGAPPLNLTELEARLRAEAGIFAVDSAPPGVLSLSEEWALLQALRETRGALAATISMLKSGEPYHDRECVGCAKIRAAMESVDD